jgi:Fe-S-cluster-containing hydrogenase component 2
MTQRRKIIRIDESKCNGCGLCVPSCAEGALKIVDGKARLVSDVYCDGLGACLGHCPQDALTVEERDAEEFNLAVAEKHQRQQTQEAAVAIRAAVEPGPAPVRHACPGTRVQFFQPDVEDEARKSDEPAWEQPSALRNWPVQLSLVPTQAPYFDGARLLIAADCVPFALAGFHSRLLEGRILLIGCPKLDAADEYQEKLAEIFRENDIREVEVAHMEVPCCYGLVHLVQLALEASGKRIPLTLRKIGIRGGILETTGPNVPAGAV